MVIEPNSYGITSITGEWRAIGSTKNDEARDNALVQGPVYNTRGEMVAADSADIWDGSLLNPIRYTETGDTPSSNFTWDGLEDFRGI